MDVVQAVTAERWLSLSTLAVGAASVGPQGLAIGANLFADARVSLEGDRLTVLRDGWRVEAFTRYRPLVYFAAFGAEDVFACLRLAVASLFEFGGYEGDVLVLTDAAHLGWPACLPDPVRGRVQTHALPGADMLDWTLARYRLPGLAMAAGHRPFLYLDADMVCDAPLGPLLARLAVSSAMQAPAEQPLVRPEDWYGASLLAADGIAVPPDRRGFSTGALGFPDLAAVRALFALVPALAEAHAARSGRRDAFDCYDQPFANYAAVKQGGVGLGLMGHFLDNRHYWHDRPPMRRGLAHFTGGTGAAAAKLAAMDAYVKRLRAPG